MTLEFPEYHWLSDVGMRISKFVGQHDNLTYVTVGIVDDTKVSLLDAMFTLVAKDGVYIDKGHACKGGTPLPTPLFEET